MRAIDKTIHQEIWASPLSEDTRRRLSFLHSGLNVREESNLRDMETNLRNAECSIQRISERLKRAKASEENEYFRFTSAVHTAIFSLVAVLEAAIEVDAAWVVKDDIRALVDADGPIPFDESLDGKELGRKIEDDCPEGYEVTQEVIDNAD